MANVLPINFPLPSESAVASYDYYDFTMEGTGMKLFYAATSGTANANKFLTANQVYSLSPELGETGIAVNVGYVKEMDFDFDLSAFNMHKTVKGIAIIQVCSDMEHTGGTTGYYIIAKVRKWDGSSETEIGSGTSATYAVASTPRVEAIAVSCTETVFKKGDILRVTIEGWVSQTIAGTADIYIGVEPMNSDGTNIVPSTDDPESTTQLKCWIPFKLNL